MYKLQNVYSVISINKNTVDFLSVEKKTSKMNCLYYTSKPYVKSNLLDTLLSLTKETDKFLSFETRKYIINIEDAEVHDKYIDHEEVETKRILNTLHIAKIKTLFLTTNALNYQYPCLVEKENSVVVKINENETEIFYYIMGEFVQKITFNVGYLRLVNTLANILNVKTDKLIRELKMASKLTGDVNLFNIYDCNFLTLTSIKTSDFKEMFNKVFNKYFDELKDSIKNIKFDTMIFIKTNENAFALDILKKQECDFEIIVKTYNNLVGLEDENVDDLIYSILYTNMIQVKNNNLEYSKAPYISQRVSERQIKQQILLGFGIMSTNYVASLGKEK